MIKAICAIVAILGCMAVVVGASFYISSLKSELKLAQDKVEILENAQKLSQEAEIKARAARQVENEKSKERERLMQNVLDGNCDWSRIELPDDVTWMLQYGETGNSGLCPSGDTP